MQMKELTQRKLIRMISVILKTSQLRWMRENSHMLETTFQLWIWIKINKFFKEERSLQLFIQREKTRTQLLMILILRKLSDKGHLERFILFSTR